VFFDLLLRGHAVAGVRSYASVLGMNERTVRKALDELVELGVGVLESSGPGLPAVISLAYAEVRNTDADVPHPYAQVQSPTYADVRPSYAPLPNPDAEIQRPNADVLHLVPPLREREESFSLLEDLSNNLPTQFVQKFWSTRDSGGRVTLGRLLEDLAEVHGGEVVVRTLLATVPAGDVRSIVAYLISQARRIKGEGSTAAHSRSSQPPPPTNAEHTSNALDPVLADAVSFATFQARSVTSADEVPTVRRGIELEFSHDERARRAALDTFEQLVGV
jgi:hypothetical protein